MGKGNEDGRSIAESIAKIRQDRKLSQAEFAEQVGVTRQAVIKWENGSMKPPIQNLRQISEIFHIPLNEIVSDKEIQMSDRPVEIFVEKTPRPVKRKKELVWDKFSWLGTGLIVEGFICMVILPFIAENKRQYDLHHTGAAYTYAYSYISAFPLSIVLILAILVVVLGYYLIRTGNERKK